MTKQEIFDKVVHHLFKQGRKAVDSNGSCMYRTTEGLSCAVGCLIPDKLYHPSIEGVIVRTIMNPYENEEAYEKISDFLGKENEVFLSALQQIHDSVLTISNGATFDTDDLYMRLESFAKRHELSTESLEEYLGSLA